MVLQVASKQIFPEHHLDSISAADVQASGPALPHVNRIIDGLYIGDLRLALQVLRRNDHMGVTHVLSLVSSSIISSMCKNCEYTPASIFCSDEKLPCTHFQTAKHGSCLLRMVVPLMDTPDEDILQVLQPCFEFIDEGRKRGIVLVHCMAGRSRSAAIVTAYLMRTLRLSMKQAMETVNRNYKKASPNVGYMWQLEQFEMRQRKLREGLCNGKSVCNSD